MVQLFLLSSILMVASLAWVFRHPVGVMVPAVVIVLSNIWTFGMMAWRKPATLFNFNASGFFGRRVWPIRFIFNRCTVI